MLRDGVILGDDDDSSVRFTTLLEVIILFSFAMLERHSRVASHCVCPWIEPRELLLPVLSTSAKYTGEAPVTFTCVKHTGNFPGSSATTLRCNLGVYPLARRTGTLLC